MSADLTLKIKAVDEASATLQNVGDNSAAAFTKAAESAEKTGMSFSEVATKASNLANVGFNLYNSYDRIGDAQLRVEKASVTLRSAVDSERTAQMTLNRAVEKYGEDSDQAVAAKEMLITASERVRISEMQLEENQSRVNDAMMQGSIQAVPALIGGFGTLKELMPGLSGAFTTAMPAMTGAFSSFATTMMAHPILLVIAAIVIAVILLYKAWETNFGGIRDITAGAFNFLKGVFEGFLGFGGRVVDFFKGLGGVIKDALKGVLNIYIGIMNLAIGAINILIKAYNSTIGLLPGVAKIGELPKILPLQEGGVVTKPTLALIGEAGPEAVIPLGIGMSNKSIAKDIIDLMWNAGSALSRSIFDIWEGRSKHNKFEDALTMITQAGGYINKAFIRIQDLLPIWDRPTGPISFAAGGIVTSPTLAVLGEAGPEAVVPLGRGGFGGNVTVNLVVEGSADRKTIDYAKREIWKELKSVIQESTSASATTKRIRRS